MAYTTMLGSQLNYDDLEVERRVKRRRQDEEGIPIKHELDTYPFAGVASPRDLHAAHAAAEIMLHSGHTMASLSANEEDSSSSSNCSVGYSPTTPQMLLNSYLTGVVETTSSTLLNGSRGMAVCSNDDSAALRSHEPHSPVASISSGTTATSDVVKFEDDSGSDVRSSSVYLLGDGVHDPGVSPDSVTLGEYQMSGPSPSSLATCVPVHVGVNNNNNSEGGVGSTRGGCPGRVSRSSNHVSEADGGTTTGKPNMVTRTTAISSHDASAVIGEGQHRDVHYEAAFHEHQLQQQQRVLEDARQYEYHFDASRQRRQSPHTTRHTMNRSNAAVLQPVSHQHPTLGSTIHQRQVTVDPTPASVFTTTGMYVLDDGTSHRHNHGHRDDGRAFYNTDNNISQRHHESHLRDGGDDRWSSPLNSTSVYKSHQATIQHQAEGSHCIARGLGRVDENMNRHRDPREAVLQSDRTAVRDDVAVDEDEVAVRGLQSVINLLGGGAESSPGAALLEALTGASSTGSHHHHHHHNDNHNNTAAGSIKGDHDMTAVSSTQSSVDVSCPLQDLVECMPPHDSSELRSQHMMQSSSPFHGALVTAAAREPRVVDLHSPTSASALCHHVHHHHEHHVVNNHHHHTHGGLNIGSNSATAVMVAEQGGDHHSTTYVSGGAHHDLGSVEDLQGMSAAAAIVAAYHQAARQNRSLPSVAGGGGGGHSPSSASAAAGEFNNDCSAGVQQQHQSNNAHNSSSSSGNNYLHQLHIDNSSGDHIARTPHSIHGLHNGSSLIHDNASLMNNQHNRVDGGGHHHNNGHSTDSRHHHPLSVPNHQHLHSSQQQHTARSAADHLLAAVAYDQQAAGNSSASQSLSGYGLPVHSGLSPLDAPSAHGDGMLLPRPASGMLPLDLSVAGHFLPEHSQSFVNATAGADYPHNLKRGRRKGRENYQLIQKLETLAAEEGFEGEDGVFYKRPDVDDATIGELCDITPLHRSERFSKLIVDFEEGISFPLGEGGRELLRACLNAKGCKGRQLQGASVPMLLQLARDWGLWNVAVRIKVERATGELSPNHEAFVKFKAMQSQLRKYLKREHMITERDDSGKITDIHFEEMKYLTLGKDGREKLRAQLRRMHDKDPQRMDELLERSNFKYSELRNATVPQLLKMAHICGMWDEVVNACRQQEQKRDEKTVRRDFHFVGAAAAAASSVAPPCHTPLHHQHHHHHTLQVMPPHHYSKDTPSLVGLPSSSLRGVSPLLQHGSGSANSTAVVSGSDTNSLVRRVGGGGALSLYRHDALDLHNALELPRATATGAATTGATSSTGLMCKVGGNSNTGIQHSTSPTSTSNNGPSHQQHRGDELNHFYSQHYRLDTGTGNDSGTGGMSAADERHYGLSANTSRPFEDAQQHMLRMGSLDVESPFNHHLPVQSASMDPRAQLVNGVGGNVHTGGRSYMSHNGVGPMNDSSHLISEDDHHAAAQFQLMGIASGDNVHHHHTQDLIEHQNLHQQARTGNDPTEDDEPTPGSRQFYNCSFNSVFAVC
eukprot:Lankesteria_metandrocarpae@DN2432_c0_g1_i1.p1